MMKKVILWIGGIIIILWIVGECSSNSDTPAQEISTSSASTDVATEKPSSEQIEELPTSKWEYSESEDEMTSKMNKFAQLVSENILTFDFPYQGGSTSTLTIRKKDNELDIYVTVKPSQMVIDVTVDMVKVRFDKDNPSSYSISQAADYSFDMFFFSNPSRLLQKIKKSKKMLVQCNFVNHGYEIIEFDIKDLDF